MTNAHIIERLTTYREHLNQQRHREPSGHTVIEMQNIRLTVNELIETFAIPQENAALQGLKSLTLSQLGEAHIKINQLADPATNLEGEDGFWDALNALTDPIEQFVDSIQASKE